MDPINRPEAEASNEAPTKVPEAVESWPEETIHMDRFGAARWKAAQDSMAREMPDFKTTYTSFNLEHEDHDNDASFKYIDAARRLHVMEKKIVILSREKDDLAIECCAVARRNRVLESENYRLAKERDHMGRERRAANRRSQDLENDKCRLALERDRLIQRVRDLSRENLSLKEKQAQYMRDYSFAHQFVQMMREGNLSFDETEPADRVAAFNSETTVGEDAGPKKNTRASPPTYSNMTCTVEHVDMRQGTDPRDSNNGNAYLAHWLSGIPAPEENNTIPNYDAIRSQAKDRPPVILVCLPKERAEMEQRDKE
ncbi:hypothetical protein F4678DRAFT_458459 [Xylaria arbuscula]|nr:hypothetical protein F4678DRAFT_458459 [Xylaria arbuscula]